MGVSPIASSLQARDQGSVPGTESKPGSAAADFANLVQTATKNFASSLATQTSDKKAALREKAAARPDRATKARQDMAQAPSERPASTQKRDDARKLDDNRPLKEKTARIERENTQQGDAAVVPSPMAEPLVAQPQAPVAAPESGGMVSREMMQANGTAPAAVAPQSGGATPMKAGDAGAAVPVMDEGAVPVDPAGAELDGEAALLQAARAPMSAQEQAQAEALARVIAPNAAPLRVTVTAEHKAPVAYSTSNVSGQAAAVAQALSGADGEASMSFNEQNAYSGGQGGNGGQPHASGQATPVQQAAAQPFFGVSNAPAFVVPTMTATAAGGQAVVPPQVNGGQLAGADGDEALLSQPGSPMTAGQDGAGATDRLSGTAMADFSQTLRGAAKNDAAPQPYTQRPVVQSSPDQVHVHIRKAFGDGADQITIQLRPAHLGRIDVRIETAQDGSVTAHIQADKAETLDMMARDARSLEQALKDAGLQADRDSLNFSLRGEERQHAEGNDDNGRRSGRNASHATDGGEETPDLASSDAVGPNDDGSLDIRV